MSGGAQGQRVAVVAAALIDDGRCLAAQRGEQMSAPLAWEFPGGKLEPGETPEQALVREIREELGLEIRVQEFLGLVTTPRIELSLYRAELRGGTLELAEHRQVGWFTADELAQLDWSEADRPLLPLLQKCLNLP